MSLFVQAVAGRETSWQFRGSTLFFAGMNQDTRDTTAGARPATGSIPAGATCDPTAWVELHGNYLFRYAIIRVRNETVAEDLVQDALLAAFQGKERFTGESTERGWLTGILKHKIMDHFRHLAKERPVNADDALPSELADRFDELGLWKHVPETGPANWGADAGTLMERQEFMAALKECLSKLPPRHADAFVLREMEDAESERIQETLGVSPSNFWVLLHRARMQLRLCLEQNWLNL
jgi:RNA polymerase sigma-70 factor (TIGR02943 family)